MTISVKVDTKRQLDVSAATDFVFQVLADVPRSVSHFPKVAELIDEGGGTYLWKMEPIGEGKHFVQVIYACTYTSERSAATVRWDPVKGKGNALMHGSWQLSSRGGGTHIDFDNHTTLEVQLPALIKPIAGPIIRREFEKLIDRYLENLKKTFAG